MNSIKLRLWSHFMWKKCNKEFGKWGYYCENYYEYAKWFQQDFSKWTNGNEFIDST